MGLMDKFSQGKRMMKMVQQAKALEKELEQETIEVEKGNVKVVVNGTMRVKELIVDGQSQDFLKEIINDALKKAQKKASKKAAALGNLFGF